MSALTNVWQAFTSLTRISDDVTQIGLTSIESGISVDDYVEVTGVDNSTLYEGVKFRVTATGTNTINIDWTDHSLTAPADTWSVGGMVRLYQTPVPCGMRVSFNPHNITTLTSTGSTATEYSKDNILSSNRAEIHTLSGGVDHTLIATVSASTDKLINSVCLIDLVADTDTLIRIQGVGAVHDIDVVYPIPARYTLTGRPAVGYPGVSADGYNANDPIQHGVFYVPAMMTDDVTITLIGSTTDIEISELLLSAYWTPEAAINFDWGSSTIGRIVSSDVRRGRYLYRQRDGLDMSRAVTITMMDEADCTYVDLLMKSGGTIVFDSYPNEDEKRWRNMVVGYLVGDISTQHFFPGNTVELNVADTKLHGGI